MSNSSFKNPSYITECGRRVKMHPSIMCDESKQGLALFKPDVPLECPAFFLTENQGLIFRANWYSYYKTNLTLSADFEARFRDRHWVIVELLIQEAYSRSKIGDFCYPLYRVPSLPELEMYGHPAVVDGADSGSEEKHGLELSRGGKWGAEAQNSTVFSPPHLRPEEPAEDDKLPLVPIDNVLDVMGCILLAVDAEDEFYFYDAKGALLLCYHQKSSAGAWLMDETPCLENKTPVWINGENHKVSPIYRMTEIREKMKELTSEPIYMAVLVNNDARCVRGMDFPSGLRYHKGDDFQLYTDLAKLWVFADNYEDWPDAETQLDADTLFQLEELFEKI